MSTWEVRRWISGSWGPLEEVVLEELDGHEAVQTTRLVKVGSGGITADQLMEKPSKADMAEKWLREQLKDGPIPAKTLNERLEETNFSAGTLSGVKRTMEVESQRALDGTYVVGYRWHFDKNDDV